MSRQVPVHYNEPKIGRNDPCTCGSGKKWKRCHLLVERAERDARDADREERRVERLRQRALGNDEGRLRSVAIQAAIAAMAGVQVR